MNRITAFNIFPSVLFMIVSISNLYAILYKSATKTLYITYLYFIKDRNIIFILLIPSKKQII